MSTNKQKLVSSTSLAENVILAITVVASILCLVPLMVAAGGTATSTFSSVIPSTNATASSTTSPLTDDLTGTDDDAWFYETTDFLQNLSGFFYVVLVPVVDIILEVPGWVIHHLTLHCHRSEGNAPPTPKVSPTQPNSPIVRLSEVERFLFIFGIAFISSASFVSAAHTQVDVYTMYDCSSDFSAIMTIGPLVSFLVRATTAFTPRKGVLIMLCVALGGLFDAFQYLFPDRAEVMTLVAYICFYLAACSFTLVCGLSVVGLVRERWGSVTRGKMTSYLREFLVGDVGSGRGHDHKASDDWYELYVPALHMVSVLIMLWINAMWYSISADLVLLFHFWTRSTIAAATIVLVVEIRIRKNEVTRGLYALLESKKTYVRFISHEMRWVRG